MTTHMDGTFDFCGSCAANNNCCVRTRHGFGQVANPPLLPHEEVVIAAHTGLRIEDFAEPTVPSGNGVAIKREGEGCYFYQGGRCAIYAKRPFDCRIFPFDIIERQGDLFWIVYTSLCPINFDSDRYLASAKQALRDSDVQRTDLITFTRHGREEMSRHPFKILEKLILERQDEPASA